MGFIFTDADTDLYLWSSSPVDRPLEEDLTSLRETSHSSNSLVSCVRCISTNAVPLWHTRVIKLIERSRLFFLSFAAETRRTLRTEYAGRRHKRLVDVAPPSPMLMSPLRYLVTRKSLEPHLTARFSAFSDFTAVPFLRFRSLCFIPSRPFPTVDASSGHTVGFTIENIVLLPDPGIALFSHHALVKSRKDDCIRS